MQQLNSNAELQGGKYKILGTLGQGGYGITYLAEHTLLSKKVAIKEFFPREYCDRFGDTSHVTLGTTSNRDLVERLRAKFVKEARNLARLNNPGIVKIYDVFEENNTAYYVMEWIDGPELSKVISEKGQLEASVAIRYITQVGHALSYVHQHNITHLDVKPGNIMIRRDDDHAVLIDFGLSKQYNETGGQTSTGPVGITHGYAPIEQYRPDGMNQFSPETDVYALAATLYKALTGINPPQAIELLESPLQIPDYVNPKVAAAIRAGMAPSKNARTKTVDEFIKAINVAATPKPGAATQGAAKKKIESDDTVIDPFEVSGVKASAAQSRRPESPRKPQKGKSGIVVAGSLLAAVALGAIAYFAIARSGGDDSLEEQTEVLANGPDSVAAAEAPVVAAADVTAPVEETKPEPKTEPKPTPTPAPKPTPVPVGNTTTSASNPTPNPTPNPAPPAAGASASELYRQGVDAFNNENYAQAASLYRQAAEKGNAQAQCALGECYYRGWGVGKDKAASFNWYRKAAQQGLAKAQYELGDCYRYGIGTSVNYDEARRWYSLAAAQGHANAQRALDNL